MFTGRHAFESLTNQGFPRLRDQMTPTPPSQIVKDIIPPFEQVILRCLENDAQKRPTTVLEVSAMLDQGPIRWQRMALDLDEARHSYAREIGARANVRSQLLLDALANVRREHFLGAAPWTVSTGTSARLTEETDPRTLYQDVAVAVDTARNLYNGWPSAVASWLDAADIQKGDRVFHLGCGVGYYTAIIAEIVGLEGRVVGIEVDGGLASRAKANLAYLSNVEVLTGDGSQYDLEPCDVILIHAGVTHPRSLWLDRLRPGGRLLLPLTFDFSATKLGKGAVLVIRRASLSFAAFFLPQPVLISSCSGIRDHELNEKLLSGLRAGMVQSVHSLRRGVHEPDSTCCLHSDRFHFCLSNRAPL
jgi:protein-L-isoaspartate(D-aspartate) O-methyltransferase